MDRRKELSTWTSAATALFFSTAFFAFAARWQFTGQWLAFGACVSWIVGELRRQDESTTKEEMLATQGREIKQLLADVAARDARAERYQNEIRGLTKELEHLQRFVRQIPREGGDE